MYGFDQFLDGVIVGMGLAVVAYIIMYSCVIEPQMKRYQRTISELTQLVDSVLTVFGGQDDAGDL